MSISTPAQASSIKKGHNAILKSRPCKIVDVSISKTGKHGHAKCHFSGIDIFFPNKKYEEICPSTHNMLQPILVRTEYQLMDIDDDDFLSLLDTTGNAKDNVKLRDCEIDKEVKEKFNEGNEIDLTILSWGSEEGIIAYKVINM